MELLLGVLEYSFIPAYGITLLLAVFRFPKYFDTPLKYFPVIVCYTLVTEMLGYFIRKFDEYDLFLSEIYAEYNVPIYNIYNIIFYLYWFYVFESYLPINKARKFRIGAVVIFALTAAINPFIQKFGLGHQFYTYVVGGAVLITYVISYLADRYRSTGEIFQKDDLLSWLALGLFCFYAGYLPIKISRFFRALEGLRFEPSYFRYVTLLLIVLMYTLFCIGLWKMRKMRYIRNPQE